MAAQDTDYLPLWNLGPQQLLVDFQGGQLSAATTLAPESCIVPVACRVEPVLAPVQPSEGEVLRQYSYR
jgi:hypothetical protein